jgi:UDP:flavonoid glycosyltransferase YjiC (YdhE family)
VVQRCGPGVCEGSNFGIEEVLRGRDVVIIVVVRLLFAFVGGAGHAEPLVPVARAAEAAGNAVVFSGRASVVGHLRERGFAVFADPIVAVDELRSIAPLVEYDAAREDAVLRNGFASRLARERVTRVLALCKEWRPDAIVCDEVDFGSMIAAEHAGLPHATVLVIAAGALIRAEVVAAPLDALRAEHGLAPDPGLAMPSRHLVLAPGPPSFRDPAFPLPANAHAIRPELGPAPRLAPANTIYFTLGTVFNVESGDLFSRVLAGLRELPVDVIATVGGQLDPARLGPQPENVRIERHVRQADVLSRCDLMVSHGGSGSVIGALTAGVPSIVLPMGADQPHNAARCEALGVGRTLDTLRATPEEIRTAALEVLENPSYRAAAARLREETLALPGPDHAVELLERLRDGRSAARARA